MDVKLDLKSYHIMLPGDGIGNPIQAEAIIFAYLPLFLEAKDIIQVNPIKRS